MAQTARYLILVGTDRATLRSLMTRVQVLSRTGSLRFGYRGARIVHSLLRRALERSADLRNEHSLLESTELWYVRLLHFSQTRHLARKQ